MWLNGYVPLRRGHLPSIRRMLRKSEAELRAGASLCVFPEGTRSRDGELKAFYRGAFWIAVRAGVPRRSRPNRRNTTTANCRPWFTRAWPKSSATYATAAASDGLRASGARGSRRDEGLIAGRGL
jgi:1-acyl-sn-glycerol-3-phosphate acyltransferase